MKKCSKCGQTKSYSAFSRRRSSSDGYNQHCLECVQKYNRERYARSEEVRKDQVDRVKRWEEVNRARKNQTHQLWVQNNLESHRMYKRAAAQKRRGFDQQAEGIITKEVIDRLYEESEDHCGYCGIRLFGIFHVDHMQPLSREGSNLAENLCVCCPSCNLSKNDKTVAEWEAIRGW